MTDDPDVDAPSRAASDRLDGSDMRTQEVEPAAGPGLDREHPVHRVLVAFNGTDAAWAALRAGIRIALSFHAQLTIAGVVKSPPPIAYVATEMIAMPHSPQALERELAARDRAARGGRRL